MTLRRFVILLKAALMVAPLIVGIWSYYFGIR